MTGRRPPPVEVAIPATFTAQAARDAEVAAFLDRLPRMLRELVAEWRLDVDGPPRHGHTALAVPVRTAEGRAAVLKVGLPHAEAQHEHLALRAWRGQGAVELLRADPHRAALLLERLDAGQVPIGAWDLEACEVVAGLYARLHVPALPQLRTLSSYVVGWTERLAALPADAPLPRRLVEQAVSLGRAFAEDEATDARTIHADLHYENVLAADREPWLVIDPKPVAGDPHYEPAPMLWNRWAEVVDAPSVREAVRARFFALVDGAGLDEDRARDWVVVRALHAVLWVIEDQPGHRRRLGPAERDEITTLVTVAKSVQG